jgi:hypothetical protein
VSPNVEFLNNSLTSISASEVQGDTPESSTPVGATLEDADPSILRDIDFDDGWCPYTAYRFGG